MNTRFPGGILLHSTDANGMNEPRPQDVQGQEPVPDAVAREVDRACDQDATGKTGDHFKSRRKLFEEVDKLIRGRVREILPSLTLEFKQQLDKDLGLEVMRQRVNRVSTGLSKDLDAITARLEPELREGVDLFLDRIKTSAADAVVRSFERRVTRLVVKECARQFQRFVTDTVAVKTKKQPRKG